MLMRHCLQLGVYRIVVLDYSAEYNLFCEVFGRIRIRIALAAEHFYAAPTVLIFTTSLNSCGWLYDKCFLSAVVVYDFADALS